MLLTSFDSWTYSNFKRGTYSWCHSAFERGPEQSAQWSALQHVGMGFRAENLWKLDFSDFKSLNSRSGGSVHLQVDSRSDCWEELRDPTESDMPAQPVKFCEFSIEIATSEKSAQFLDVPPEAPA